MFNKLKLCVFAALACLATVQGQDATYFTNVTTPKWIASVGAVEQGNGAFLSPSGGLLVVVGRDASVRAINPSNGAQLWAIDGGTTNSYGGAFFATYLTQPYILYSVVSDATTAPTSKIVALNPADGSILYETESFKGAAKGTPVASSDGSLILTTSNEDGVGGTFSIFNYGTAAVNFTFTSFLADEFGALGYYYNPIEGNFPGGEGNRNDLFMWSVDTPKDATEAGNGRLFAFQVPLPAINPTPFAVTPVGNQTSFQSPHPPVFANSSYLMYFACSKSEIRYWQGSGLPRDQFDRGVTDTAAFVRGNPRYAAPGGPPTLSSDATAPFLYGASAGLEIYKMPFNLADPLIVSTATYVSNKVLLSPDDLYVYYADQSGTLAQLDAADLSVTWSAAIGVSVFGEMAQSADGAFIYVPDNAGTLYAFQVKDSVVAFTEAPIAAPVVTKAPVVDSASDEPSDTDASDEPSAEDNATAEPMDSSIASNSSSSSPTVKSAARSSNGSIEALFTVVALLFSFAL